LEKYVERNLLYKKQINNLQDRASDLRRSMNTSLNILKNMDGDLLEMLSNMSDDIVNEKFSTLEKIKEWWNANVEYTDNNGDKIISTELWNKFKKENKEYVGVNNLNIEQFKDAITGNVVNSSNYIEKTKKGAIEFIGFKWKDVEVKQAKQLDSLDDLELENTIIENKYKVKTKKI
jgi:hypothetical protein